MQLPYIPPYKTKTVEPVYFRSREERAAKIKEVNYYLFNLHSDWVIVDLITDSGTGAMSEQQWAEIMLGDESYAGSESYFKLIRAVQRIMGFEYVAPTHQGRAAENVLFSAIVKEGHVIPGNADFDTTKGHIEFRKAQAIDCTIAEAFNTAGQLDKLEAFASHYGADYYGLPRNQEQLTLVKEEQTIPETLAFGKEEIVPFRAGGTCSWQLKN